MGSGRGGRGPSSLARGATGGLSLSQDDRRLRGHVVHLTTPLDAHANVTALQFELGDVLLDNEFDEFAQLF